MAPSFSLLFLLYVRPLKAMSRILDEGSWLFGAAAVLAVSMLAHAPFLSPPGPAHQASAAAQAPAGESEATPAANTLELVSSRTSLFTALIVLAAVYVPATIFFATLLEPLGGFSTVLYRDYTSLLACACMGWAAANLPFTLLHFAWRPGDPVIAGGMIAIPIVCFAALMLCAVRVVFGSGFGTGAAVAVLGAVPAGAVLFYYDQFGFILSWLASPFLLFLAYRYFAGELSMLGRGLSQRQSFRRQLEAASVNPNDSDAQYQLGLLYQQRRQYAEAIERFQRAVRIDPQEADSHFQLGRIAREQGRMEEALRHFETVVRINPKHSSHEPWRETGAVHLASGRPAEAREVLERYIDQRPYDAEGLYYLGQALERTGDAPGARDAYQRCVEAVNTAPQHRRRLVSRWGKLAQSQLR